MRTEVLMVLVLGACAEINQCVPGPGGADQCAGEEDAASLIQLRQSNVTERVEAGAEVREPGGAVLLVRGGEDYTKKLSEEIHPQDLKEIRQLREKVKTQQDQIKTQQDQIKTQQDQINKQQDQINGLSGKCGDQSTQGVTATEWRMVLTWNEQSTNLDARVAFAEPNRDHEYCQASWHDMADAYKNYCNTVMPLKAGNFEDVFDSSVSSNTETVFLRDVDPEKCKDKCMIYYYVKDQAENADGDAVFLKSDARVEVIHGDESVATFSVESEDAKIGGGYWDVFAIDVKAGKVIACSKNNDACG